MLGDHDSAVAGGSTDNVSRQPSLRQQEKAPEGRPPHVSAAEDGAEPDATNAAAPESRFTEGL